MFNFLAKIGRKRWAKNCTTGLAMAVPIAFYVVPEVHLDLMESLLTAQSPSGEREEISDSLRGLIDETYNEVKNQYHPAPTHAALAAFEERLSFGQRNHPIRWFCSTTVDPITFGSSDMRTGVLIGLPTYYNYNDRQELPSNLFRVNSIDIFRKYFKKKQVPEDPHAETQDSNVTSCIEIDKQSEIGRDYADSLVLSKEAKKFSIAKQIFLVDSYRVVARYGASCVSIALVVAFTRAMVRKLRLSDAHVSQRLTMYMVSGILGYLYHKFFLLSVDDYFEQRAFERAIAAGEDYKSGSAEAIEKAMKRQELLSKIIAQAHS